VGNAWALTRLVLFHDGNLGGNFIGSLINRYRADAAQKTAKM